MIILKDLFGGFFINGRIYNLHKTRTPYEFEQMKSSFPVQALRVYF